MAPPQPCPPNVNPFSLNIGKRNDMFFGFNALSPKSTDLKKQEIFRKTKKYQDSLDMINLAGIQGVEGRQMSRFHDPSANYKRRISYEAYDNEYQASLFSN
jgi:hypothetical protein